MRGIEALNPDGEAIYARRAVSAELPGLERPRVRLERDLCVDRKWNARAHRGQERLHCRAG